MRIVLTSRQGGRAESARITEGDQGTTVLQAVPVPEGVRYETTVTP